LEPVERVCGSLGWVWWRLHCLLLSLTGFHANTTHIHTHLPPYPPPTHLWVLRQLQVQEPPALGVNVLGNGHHGGVVGGTSCIRAQ
jgi:hypothetical protein